MRYRFGLIGVAFVVAACATATSQSSGDAGSRDLGAGRHLALARCGGCHAVDKSTAVSPHGSAPRFADIVRMYPPESLSEALSEGITVGHEDMPEFRFTDEEVGQLITYLKSLE